MKSIVKAITWRLIAASTTMFVVAFLSWHATGTIDWGTGGTVAAIAGTLKMVFYVWHDKAYAKYWRDANETKASAPTNPAWSIDRLNKFGLVKGMVRDANDPLNDDFYVIAD